MDDVGIAIALTRLEVAVSVLNVAAQRVDARRAHVRAELDALLQLGDDGGGSKYKHCLFCHAEYGMQNATNHPVDYDAIHAACDCEGVGWRCAAGEKSYASNHFKTYGCNSFNKLPLPQCYNCSRSVLVPVLSTATD